MLHARCYMLNANCYMLHAKCYMLDKTINPATCNRWDEKKRRNSKIAQPFFPNRNISMAIPNRVLAMHVWISSILHTTRLAPQWNPLISYSTAKHLKHSELRVSFIQIKPVIFQSSLTVSSNFHPQWLCLFRYFCKTLCSCIVYILLPKLNVFWSLVNLS